MKTAFTTFAIVSLVAVSSASADHKDHGCHIPPAQLAHVLHVHAQNLEQEMEHHYPHAHGMHQKTYILSRLAISTEREVRLGNVFGAWQNLRHIDGLLHDVDLFLRKSIVNSGRNDGRHIRKSVHELHEMTQSLEHSMKHAHIVPPRHVHIHSGAHHDHVRVQRVVNHNHRGHDRHADHGHSDHGHGDRGHRGYRDDDHIVSRPGMIHIHRGGLVFGIRTR